MPINRSQKVELIDAYKAKIEGSQAVVIAEYRGLTVSQMQKLRGLLRPLGGSFVVAKNTLMMRALNELHRPTPTQLFKGPVGFAFLGEDIAANARVLRDFTKEAGELFIVRGGILGQTVLDASGATSLADLPTREVQLAQLVGAIAAPMSSLASLLTAPHRDLIGLLQARIDKEGGFAEAA